MAELFTTKVRRVGTSLGLLIPAAVVRQEGLREGQEVSAIVLRERTELIEKLVPMNSVSLSPAERKKLVASSFGIARGAKRFVRDHRDRF